MTRFEKSWQNYQKLYREKKARLKKYGFKMADKKLTKKEYKMVRESYKSENVKNINKRIVSDQAYEYNAEFAKNLKRISKEKGLEWKNFTTLEIKKGAVDVSALNDYLKEANPNWTGKQRQQYISYEVYGS